MNSTQSRITLLSALFGLFFGAMTLVSLLMAGAGLQNACATAMIAFAEVMLAAHLFLSAQDAIEMRRYARFEQTLGEAVTARFVASIFAGSTGMGGMIYVLRDRLLLASVGRRGRWEATLRPGEMHHAEQLDPLTLQLSCLDGRVFRVMTAPIEDLIDDLRALGISVVELPEE